MPFAERLVAHRGYRRHYPENTLLAHREAVAAGARAIETDIQLSADLQPVLYHDATLARVSGRRGRIDAHPLGQLLGLPAHEPRRFGQRFAANTITPLAALAAWLADHPEVTAYVEVKREALAFAGAAACYRSIADCLAPIAGRCVLISFDYAFIAHARERGWRRCGLVLERWRDHHSRELAGLHPEALFCDYRKVPARARLDDLVPELVLYEIATADLALHWLERGADRIETFDIGGLLHALTRHRL
ncbi:MAG: glycerophosphodiester phosphodiesterase family protein [Pseudomonadota bacterium]